MEQRAVKTAGASVIDILDARLLAQFGDAQPRREALILAPGRLAIEQKPEPFVMAEPVGLTVGGDFDEGLRPSMRAKGVELIEGGMCDKSSLLIVVARATDVGVQDRRSVRARSRAGRRSRLLSRMDLTGRRSARRCRWRVRRRLPDARRSGAREPDDAQTGAKALLGMWSRLKDQFAQGRRRRPDQARVGADALDRPAGIAPMAGRHVLGDGGVLVVAAGAHMRGDPLALEKNLDGPRRQPPSTSVRAKRWGTL